MCFWLPLVSSHLIKEFVPITMAHYLYCHVRGGGFLLSNHLIKELASHRLLLYCFVCFHFAENVSP